MKKSDHSVYIFIPADGYGYGASLNNRGARGYYWSSSINSSNTGNAYYLEFNSSTVTPLYSNGRYRGMPIRAIQDAPPPPPPNAVDLGLPSGVKWADRNIGATSPEDVGLYFAWGETEGYVDAADRNAKLTAETGTTYTGGFNAGSYGRTGGASGISGDLTSANDAATVNLGGSWRMPTKEEFEELINNTTRTIVTINDKKYYKFENKTDSSKYIIIRVQGYIEGNSSQFVNEHGFYYTNKKGGTIGLSDEPAAYQYNGYGNYCDQQKRGNGLPIRPVQ